MRLEELKQLIAKVIAKVIEGINKPFEPPKNQYPLTVIDGIVQMVFNIEIHNGFIQSVLVCPDGTRLVYASCEKLLNTYFTRSILADEGFTSHYVRSLSTPDKHVYVDEMKLDINLLDAIATLKILTEIVVEHQNKEFQISKFPRNIAIKEFVIHRCARCLQRFY